MRRGDIVTVALQGDNGKPRPAVIVQADAFDRIERLFIIPLTSDIAETPYYRVNIEPGENSGLRARSQVMLDRMTNTPRSKIGSVIGHIDRETMQEIDRLLAILLGIA
ncbi:PemK-like protein (plasmid) [Sinorhizobium fredii NGR234]|uniref:PemK-like protein n=1 Tax=Sinorhizobium fredii (strain NBRC 101917 / NGR234) TaxID=394 RepID=C3KMR2_SINFN|nr:type II toxin-antitoxin system PemK/MazF family toxin [Sinorhizobium fredii]ACP23677.1 PemK-like protein [Sinorhizobium fredii NGR234]